MKTILSVFLLVYFTNAAFASNYYFSSVLGNDSRSVSEAQNPSTPWKTLSKLNSFFSSLKPGDKVYLKRGETFYGSIVVKQSGSSSSPIVIGAYGTGSRPVITSLVTLSGWVSKGGGIWEASHSSLGSVVNIVLLNGVVQEMGRYPNSNAPNGGYLNFEAVSGKTSITDNQLNTSINFKGAELVTRPRHWILNRSLITGHSGHKISYTTNSPYIPYLYYGYFIQNSVKLLDKVGEWYYNPSAKKLSMYFGSGGPSSVQVATTMNDLVTLNKYNNVVFDNLTFRGSNSSGFFINGGSNIHIQNCDILFSGITGILAHGINNLHVENSTISYSNTNAIDMEHTVTNAVIKNNKVLNSGLYAGLIQNGEGTGLAIYSNGDGATIENNEIRNTGFIGITFYGSNVTIKNNLIEKFCFVKDDGGGLYSHGGKVKGFNRKLLNNIIINGVGAGLGSDRPTKRSVTGIYMDANIWNVEMTGNTVTTCFQGIFIQSSAGMVLKNNLVYDNDRQMTIIGRAGSQPVRNTVMTGNNFFSKSKNQYILYIMSSANDIGSFGTFDYNYYARPVDEKQIIFNSRTLSSGIFNEAMDLAAWQKKYGKDMHTKKSPMILTASAAATSQTIIFEYNASNSAKSVPINGNFIDVTGKKYSNSVILQPYTGIVLMKTGGGGIINQSPTVNITSPGDNASFNPGASVNITASAADDDGSVAKVEFYNGVNLLGSDNSSPYSFNWTKVASGNYSLTARATDNKGAITISSPVSVSVSSGPGGLTPPNVNLTAPSFNAVYSAPASIVVTAAASDDNGSISKVEFFNGAALLKTVTSSPYSFTWSNVPEGSYSITARATDNDGLTTTSDLIPVTVTGSGGTPGVPVVNLTSPTVNATYIERATITLTAAATDIGGRITKVEFFNGPTLLHTETGAPFTWDWKNVVAGVYPITAKATDNSGLTATSSQVLVTVTGEGGSGGQAPTVAITSPGTNSTFAAPGNIPLIVAAADNGKVTKVEIFNGQELLHVETGAPWEWTWKNVKAGSYDITAKATDDEGFVKTSASIHVTVGAQASSRGSSAEASTPETAAVAPPPSSSEVAGVPGKSKSGKILNKADLSKLATFRLFPNPAVNTVQLYFEGLQTYQKASLIIRNALGATVKSYPVIISGNKIDVDVSALRGGMYFIGLSGDGFKINKKFFKLN